MIELHETVGNLIGIEQGLAHHDLPANTMAGISEMFAKARKRIVAIIDELHHSETETERARKAYEELKAQPRFCGAHDIAKFYKDEDA